MSGVQEAVERLEAALERQGRFRIDDEADIRAVLSALAASEQARERAEGERDAAMREMSMWAREAGEAKGRLEGSEMAGAVDAWREHAEAAERQRDAAVEALRQASDLLASPTGLRAEAERMVGGARVRMLHEADDIERLQRLTEGLGALQAVQGELGAGGGGG